MMQITKLSEKDAMVSELFFRLLPVQAGLIATGSINSIADGVMAARFIGPAAVGVIGLHYTLLRVLEAISSLLLGGLTITSGRHLGAGKIDRTRGVCTMVLVCGLAAGLLITALSLAMPEKMAVWLGAEGDMIPELAVYIRGYSFGVVPDLLAQLFAACLQMERREKRGELGIAVLLFTNLVLDFLFVPVLKMGIWGLALATSLSYWAYFCLVASHYLMPEAQLRPDLKLTDWHEMPRVLKNGIPYTTLVFCLALRSLVLNRILLKYAGESGLSALSSFNMMSGLLLSGILGAGQVVKMLSSIFLGEDNKEGLLSLMKILLTRVLWPVLAYAAVISLSAPLISAIFYPDRSSEVFALTCQLFRLYGPCIPLIYICTIYNSYAGAMEDVVYVNLISVIDGFLSMVIPASLLAPRMGAKGVWLSFFIGILITTAVGFLHILRRSGGHLHKAEDWLLLKPDFGGRDYLLMVHHNKEEILQTAEKVQAFCIEHGYPGKICLHAALCLEEIALNIEQHGFSADRKKHFVEIRVLPEGEHILMRIKDDCIPFDPKEWLEITGNVDPEENMGIYMVYRLSDDMNYQNLLGLNVLTIRL